MTDTAALGALAFMVLLIALVLACGAVVQVARAWADDRRREAEYADQWQAIHLKHQHDRHDHADERRPE